MNQNAVAHGIYGTVLADAENIKWQTIEFDVIEVAVMLIEVARRLIALLPGAA